MGRMPDPISSAASRVRLPDADLAPLAGTPTTPSADPAPSPAPAPTPAPAPGGAVAPLDPGASILRSLAERATARTARLPDVLMSTPNASVKHGTDPGDFYCEHLFFLSQKEAGKRGSSVVKNAAGERLVGFLHLPPDRYQGDGVVDYTQAQRHGSTRQVVGAALRGYYEDAVNAGAGNPVRLLLTGYGPFQSVVDNPTGDFVSHRENVDAALKNAFGSRLLSPRGEPVPGLPDTYAYRIADPKTGGCRTVQVALERFAVDDETLNQVGERSIQDAIRDFKPHGVLSMGVTSGDSYLAEYHADNGSLKRVDGRWRHTPGAPADVSMPDNRSLARAILRGSAPEAP